MRDPRRWGVPAVLAAAVAVAGCDEGNPEDPLDLRQYESDSATEIRAGGGTLDGTVVLTTFLPGDAGRSLALESELRLHDQPFTGQPNASSGYGPGGAWRSVRKEVAAGHPGAAYRWQARAVDAAGRASNWVEFEPALVQDHLVAFFFAASREVLESCGAGAAVTTPAAPLPWAALPAALLAAAGALRRRRGRRPPAASPPIEPPCGPGRA